MQTNIQLKLTGEDGNAFAILGAVSKALKRAGKSELWDEFQTEATNGGYDHLISTCMKWVRGV